MKRFYASPCSILFLLLYVFLTQPSWSQAPEVLWSGFYPTDYESDNFTANVILETPDGGIVMAGSRSMVHEMNGYHKVAVLSLDRDGDQLWSKSFGGNQVDTIIGSQGQDSAVYTPWDQVANAMIISGEGNYLITGYRDTTLLDASSTPGLFFLEISPDGEVLTDTLFYNSKLQVVEAHDIQPAINGGYIIIGSFNEEGESTDKVFNIELMKMGPGIWDNTGLGTFSRYDVAPNTPGYATWIRQFGDGYMLGGTAFREGSMFDLFLTKADDDAYFNPGAPKGFYGASKSDGFSGAVVSGDTVYIAGYSKVPVMGYDMDQIYVAKVDADYNVIWERTYGGPTRNYANSITRSADGDLLVAATAYTPDMKTKMALLKIDAQTGDSIWMQSYGSFYSAGIREACPTADFGTLVAGRANQSMAQDPRIYVMRLNWGTAVTSVLSSAQDLGLDISTATPTQSVIKVTAEKVPILGIFVKIDYLLHPSVGDLELSLEHSGTTVTLIDRPVHSGENFIHTGLIDMAELPIKAGYAPYTGWFVPEEPLFPFRFHDPDGDWTLTVTDHGTGGRKASTRILEGWSLNLLTESGSGTGIVTPEVLSNFGLEQIRPNPIAEEALVSFRIVRPGPVKLNVYNQLGQLVDRVVDEDLPEGLHERSWHPESLAPGTYFFHLESGGMISVRKAVLTR